jgi:hypothetical protein
MWNKLFGEKYYKEYKLSDWHSRASNPDYFWCPMCMRSNYLEDGKGSSLCFCGAGLCRIDSTNTLMVTRERASFGEENKKLKKINGDLVTKHKQVLNDQDNLSKAIDQGWEWIKDKEQELHTLIKDITGEHKPIEIERCGQCPAFRRYSGCSFCGIKQILDTPTKSVNYMGKELD